MQKMVALFTPCDAQDWSKYSRSWLSPTQKGNHVSSLPPINLLAEHQSFVSGEKIKAAKMGQEKADTTNLGQKECFQNNCFSAKLLLVREVLCLFMVLKGKTNHCTGDKLKYT